MFTAHRDAMNVLQQLLVILVDLELMTTVETVKDVDATVRNALPILYAQNVSEGSL